MDWFTGEIPEIRLENWLPTLDRAATWNEWSEEEKLMNLAGHLRGRALLEWSLLESDKESYASASLALRT